MKNLCIIVFPLLFTINCFAPPHDIKYIKKQLLIEHLKESRFSFDNLVLYLHLLEVKETEILIKQAVLETGWFRSKSFTDYNNLFGMKYTKGRPNTIAGKGLGHASFEHWTDSVDDYLLWRQYKENKGYDTTHYYQFLTTVGYATDPNYIKKLKALDVYGKDLSSHRKRHGSKYC